MYHATVRMALVYIITAVWLSGSAMAFTLRLGAVPRSHASSTFPSVEESDLPTPQLFRVAIDTHGVTLDAPHPSEGYTSSQPEIRYQEVQASSPADAPASQHVSIPATQPRLSGAELLVLRHTQVVADGQHQ